MPQSNIKIRDIEIPNRLFMPEIIRLLDEGRSVIIRLKGFSMRPFLEDRRDKALLKKSNSPKINDVALAEIDGNKYVLHRIINIQGESVTLRGDGNILTESCKLDDIKGIAVGFYRKGREKIESTNSLKWHIYSFVWTKLFPIRRYLLFIYKKFWIKIFSTKI